MFIADLMTPSSTREITPEGFLKVSARIARTGIQEYTARELGCTDRYPPDKVIRVLRPEEEVFKRESMDSFVGKPCTFNHPPKLLTVENAKGYTVGYSTAVRRDGDFLVADIVITDSETVGNINMGVEQISNGYTMELDWSEGVTDSGEGYDAVQREITGNHIAILKKGRAGPQCRINDNENHNTERPKMAKQIIAGHIIEVSDADLEAAKALDDQFTQLKGDIEELKTALDSARSEVESFDPGKSVNEALMLIDSARKIGSSVEWGSDSTPQSFIKAVVDEKCDNVPEGKSEDYYAARFDVMADMAENKKSNTLNDALTSQITAIDSSKLKDINEETRLARINRNKTNRELWRQ